VRDKKQLTQQLIKQLPTDAQISHSQACSTWWHNLRQQGGMRLTTVGYQSFKLLDLEKYEFCVDPLCVTSKLIISMDRKLQMPYYIEIKKKIPVKVVFFGSQEAVMANLYGDLKKFIDNYNP